MEVADSTRTKEFYGSVLGWTFSPGRVNDGWGVDGVAPMMGISGGHDVATTVPMYRVDDIDAAVRALRDIGGTCGEPEHNPYGVTATCTDDQGTRFYLGQL
jgi:predicted enzyme related to lactoylglutathione lyase